MISNYIKIAFRNLWRNKLYAIINIFGLSVAIGCCIVAYLDYQFNAGFDSFHKNADLIYRVESTRTINNKEVAGGIVPLPLGPALKSEFPGVVKAVRLEDDHVIVRSGDKVFNEKIWYADDGFFDIFTFPLLSGSKDVLSGDGKAVLSEEYAVKYFGTQNAVGKELIIDYGNGQKQLVTVGAVAKRIPGNSSIKFNILLPSQKLVEAQIDEPNNWNNPASALFVELQSPGYVNFLQKSMAKFVELQSSLNPDFPVSSFKFEPLRNIAETATELQGNSLPGGPPPSSVSGPIIIAILLLLMACFNYVNTSIAFSYNRMKEIGVRKVIGGNRLQLIRQFLGENLVVVTISLFVSLVVAEFLVPGFRTLFPFMEISLDLFHNTRLVLFLIILLIITVMLAGSYPAYFISRYNPAVLLHGVQKIGKSTRLMNFLLAVQFTLSITAVGTGIVFAKNAQYQESMDLGFHIDRLAFIRVNNENQYTVFRNALEQNKMVSKVAGSRDNVYFGWGRRVIQSEQKKLDVQLLSVGFNYMETMGFRLIAGRFFDRNLQSDRSNSVVITKKTVKEFGWKDPIGKTIEVDSTRYNVVGVVDDIYNFGVWRPIAPVVFKMADPSTFRFVVVRLSEPISQKTTAMLHQTWKSLFPNIPYNGSYQDHSVEEGISVSHNITTTFLVIGIFALIISTMGLFALVSLGITRRTKEIGIRKVLGAGVGNLMMLMNQKLIILLIISSLAANGLGYFTASTLLNSIYKYHVSVGFQPLLFADLLVIGVGIATSFIQTIRLAMDNPVKSIRYE